MGEFRENPGNPRSFVLDFHQKPENLVSKSPGNHRSEVIKTVFKVKNAQKMNVEMFWNKFEIFHFLSFSFFFSPKNCFLSFFDPRKCVK